jgi:hypothetical protein
MQFKEKKPQMNADIYLSAGILAGLHNKRFIIFK